MIWINLDKWINNWIEFMRLNIPQIRKDNQGGPIQFKWMNYWCYRGGWELRINWIEGTRGPRGRIR